MSSNKSTSSRAESAAKAIKTVEVIAVTAVSVGTAILCVTNPKFRRNLAERLGAGSDTKSSDSSPASATPSPPRTRSGAPINGDDGVVYLLKCGPLYKIGKAQQFERRIRQLKIQLPWAVEEIHLIHCRDISHVERYWHQRFATRRQNGEWFVLTEEEVAEFKNYTTM